MDKIDLDKVLNSIGGWGRFQIRSYVPLCCVVIFSVFQMNYIFVARDIKYRCRIKNCENETEIYNPKWLKNAVPFRDEIPNRCLFYEPMSKNTSTCPSFNKNITHRCDDYIFEKNQTTIVHDFNITCDENLWKLTIVGTISAVGELVCLSFAGFVSDHFGRKRMIVISMLCSTTIGLLKSFSPWYLIYITLEFLDTALGSGIYSGAFLLALEIVDTKRRSMGNTIICLAFAMGQVILGVAGWITSSWRILLRVIYTPGILILLSLWCVPESVRWLISKNRNEDAWKILNTASKLNRSVELDREIMISVEVNQPEKGNKKITASFRKVFKSKTLIMRIILCSYTWICCNFPYYGLTIQSVTFSEDIYINFICTALIEVPAYFLTQSTMDRIGRRKTLSLGLIFGGISCILVYIIDKPKVLTLVIFLLGKFFITVAYTTLYIYTAEMFPTHSRHTIFAICSMFGRIGSMLAPQVPLLERVFKPLPLIIFCAMAVSSGVLSCGFPETLNSKLPDEVDEAAEIK